MDDVAPLAKVVDSMADTIRQQHPKCTVTITGGTKLVVDHEVGKGVFTFEDGSCKWALAWQNGAEAGGFFDLNDPGLVDRLETALVLIELPCQLTD